MSDTDGAAENRGQWSSRWGFILAAAGGAVGLGNIWKFPYITGENGGGYFVLIYLLFIQTGEDHSFLFLFPFLKPMSFNFSTCCRNFCSDVLILSCPSVCSTKKLITMFSNFSFTIIHSVSDELSLQIQVIYLLLDHGVEAEEGDNGSPAARPVSLAPAHVALAQQRGRADVS